MQSTKQYIRDGRAPIPKNPITSVVMSANKAKNTTPELLLRKALYGAGLIGYRLHPKTIPGRPDISFTKRKIGIFVNGCFWHRCPYCKLPLPRSNKKFWGKKFADNIDRDKRKIKELRKNEWKTLTVWECQLNKNLNKEINKIINLLNIK